MILLQLSYQIDPTVVFVAVAAVTLLSAGVLFTIYPFIYLIRIFRYAKFQRSLNDLPVGARAKRLAVFTTLFDIAALIVVVILIFVVLVKLFDPQ